MTQTNEPPEKPGRFTPSAWLRRLIVGALAHQIPLSRLETPFAIVEPREHRMALRIGIEDALLLKARALSRGMLPATYVAVLLRSHLRDLAPLPKAEFLALKLTISELGAIGRDLAYLAQSYSQSNHSASIRQRELKALVALCEVVRSETKALLKANTKSWELGHRSTSH